MLNPRHLIYLVLKIKAVIIIIIIIIIIYAIAKVTVGHILLQIYEIVNLCCRHVFQHFRSSYVCKIFVLGWNPSVSSVTLMS